MGKVTKEIESFILVSNQLGLGRVRIQRMLQERGIEISHGSVHRVKAIKAQHLKDLLDFLSENTKDSNELVKEISLATVMLIHAVMYEEGEETKFELVFTHYMTAFLSVLWYHDLLKSVGEWDRATRAFEKLSRIAELVEIYISYYNFKNSTSLVFDWRERLRDLREIPPKVINSLVFLDFNREMLDLKKVHARAMNNISVFRKLAGKYLTQKRKKW